MKPNKQNKKKESTLKTIIIAIIILILLLLIMFSEDIMKIGNKAQLQESATEQTTTAVEPNIPTLSAGMIPIKWDGEYWRITSQDDPDWYNYAQGKPAYIMLNDGYYKSELQPDINPDKQLAERNTGLQILETELGTIFVWIPRYAENTDTGEIKYVEQTVGTEGDWVVSEDLFSYKQEETEPDFLLSGTWVQKDIDTEYLKTITEMQKEENIYGFIANTKVTAITTEEQTAIQKYTENLNTDDVIVNNITSLDRITLKVINDKIQDPIKASATYAKAEGKITVKITYSQYGISKIIHEQMQQETELSFTEAGGVITADTIGMIELKNGIHTITIIDNKNNKKELKIEIETPIYAVLYSDGTLAFGNSQNPIPEKTLSKSYGDISGKSYPGSSIPWYNDNSYKSITTVNFVNTISPSSCAYWFQQFNKLTEIVSINNLDTSNVTDMKYMFSNCSSLTGLDVSSFNTSNVTDMERMFAYCSSLTNLDVTGFDTSNVTNMLHMFYNCSSLTNLDVTSFNTGNVMDMMAMFYDCSSLTSLDVTSFDTSNVTNMSNMFYNCSNLTSLDVTNFDTGNVTSIGGMFGACNSLVSLDLSSFKTTNVTGMSSMFFNCSSLTSLDVTSFDTSNVIFMNRMFFGCSNLTSLDVTSFDTSNVTRMEEMFQGCSSLSELNLSSFNTAKVTNMLQMFYGTSCLKTIYVGSNWVTTQADISWMFTGCGTSSVTVI